MTTTTKTMTTTATKTMTTTATTTDLSIASFAKKFEELEIRRAGLGLARVACVVH